MPKHDKDLDEVKMHVQSVLSMHQQQLAQQQQYQSWIRQQPALQAMANTPPGFYGGNITSAPLQEHFPSLPTRKSTTPIIAQRSWALTDEYKLRSTFTSTVWEGPILRADAKPKPNVRIGDSGDDGHGIYAWHIGVPTLVHVAPGAGLGRSKPVGAVNGTVELKGTVVRHENGYRAEVVRIRNLCLVELDGRRNRNEAISALEDRYQCDVTWHFTLGDIYNSLLKEGELRIQ